MQNGAMKAWLDSSYLAGANQSYIEQLYEDFLTDPDSIEHSWRSIFQQLPTSGVKPDQLHSKTRDYFRRLAKDSSRFTSSVTDPDIDVKQVKVLQLINAFRFRGHQQANLDPIFLRPQEPVAELDLDYHNLTQDDLQESFNVGSFAIGKDTMKLEDLYDALKRTYCGSIGAEYMHMTSTEEKRWIQQRIESVTGQPSFTVEEKRRFLKELTAAEGLERYLGAKYPGAKRFSLEGADALVPMLKELIRHAGANDTREVVLGMAHRGRLNVLINVLGKKSQDLFDEFAGKHKEHLGTGDVKYHQGFSSEFDTAGGLVHLALAFNPSHLEIVSPVVTGSVRARLDRLNSQSGPRVLPITIHGDAAISGQGVVQELLNMSTVRGYEVGGTLRIVINNRIGFTTSNPLDIRSTEYCTDVGKMVQAPIFHVNADDPEAVAFVTRLALDFRNAFKRDVFIDLICYRRHGHNEADEPSATQPMMYQKIKKHPTPRKVYADRLEQEKTITQEDATEMVNLFRDALDAGECVVDEWREMDMQSFTWTPYLNHEWDEPYPHSTEMKRLQELAKRISEVPEGIEIHPRVAKVYSDRAEMAAGNKPFDWGGAETLAYATLVDEGIPIRLSGEDSGRGTFFHRHAVVHNQKNGSSYTPLNHVHNGQGEFNVWDSVLSEEAILAFEYGYATAEPRTLTIWEAQFGDFANGAQVVIDQFISSGEQKWGRMCGLVMLLPHGYEGQGPEHSSARLERYLQLCAEQNMQVCIPSTPAQVYHMLRRQALRGMRRPLVVMSPKSLLRHPLAISSLDELANGSFQPAIGEVEELDPAAVKRVVLCSGKVYYDLLEQRRKNEQKDVAIVRIEQLYPFPHQAVQAALEPFSQVHDFVWCQEEPLNQGAWYCSQHHLREVIPFGSSLRYAGRPASASPAVGYMSVHQKQQKDLVDDALNVD
ncbi:2-oxoglutarate dehydrogenase E1 component [Pectobacterium atrosepticum SCRI1043]|uniref:2-oxoglutarate dehydrogenase E1 component n=1 Tax=Pectobacterium atrosepticum (strain SCRI 1043 / ATCC BAA-672) TaxID=218491 RepID=Q6D7G4_PECAS|nr:2-oxoglutarate dehydrogenase E1 component [Pectobacterium atrosepticum]GKV86535.1 2-oxoglutarate dehydrogenase subunit E1 [Pectobacterium carotovorum subsp. carotovorum]AIA70316.1 2-oxoglutarate dehydrogenase [Pectobacterium atrosepticum]AIK13234.1 2-oxoglutarate dehydrogenase E1 component [Pectobacterium atrosepticum]ATY90140.1 2-oxoglutarate dehydrogenase E1 component [Pectobacterium atrosepticum]KFX17062.1 2-oxoglutarate dehydrogenase [Pectobacterium atrosepticum]